MVRDAASVGDADLCSTARPSGAGRDEGLVSRPRAAALFRDERLLGGLPAYWCNDSLRPGATKDLSDAQIEADAQTTEAEAQPPGQLSRKVCIPPMDH
jgi:hypothetical protein